MESGWITGDGHEVIGMAADGTEVNLGLLLWNPKETWFKFDASTLSYLAAHPMPEDW